MKTVRVTVVGRPDVVAVTGSGTTLLTAVCDAARRMFKRVGQSLGHDRVDTHEHQWTWGVGREVVVLRVVESRSGPRGESTTRQVMLRLSDENADRLDALAGRRGLNRSALVVALVDGADD